MQQNLWGEKIPRSRRKKTVIPLTPAVPFTITDQDCLVFGHTILRPFDLMGCNICADCGVKIFCPMCISAHPQDANAIPVKCPRHEETEQVIA